jgi:phenylalanyl-tRNA synthetase beta chain
VLRSSLLPGLLGALRRNVERRQGDIALFEIGTVFTHPAHSPAPRLERGGEAGRELLKVPSEDERVGLLLGRPSDDALTAVGGWRVLATALRLSRVDLVSCTGAAAVPLGMHATRCALLVAADTGAVLGAVGEVDPDVVARAVPDLGEDRRLGWLDLSLSTLADPDAARRLGDEAHLPSRFPSSDVDLALVVRDDVAVADVRRVLCEAAGELCESIVCFDAYRGAGVPAGARSLAMRVRLCAEDHTLSDVELAATRVAMIDAAASSLAASLR